MLQIDMPEEFAGIYRLSSEGWVAITWPDWCAFRFADAPLPGAAGETYVAVLVTDDAGRVCNIISHYYDCDPAGRPRRDPRHAQTYAEIDAMWMADRRGETVDHLRMAALMDWYEIMALAPLEARRELARLGGRPITGRAVEFTSTEARMQ